MPIISLGTHVHQIYIEAAKRITEYTPQLFTYKDVELQTIQAHGSSVLIKAGNSYYMATACHCVKQQDILIKVGVLDRGGHLRLISGHIVSRFGDNDEIDLAIIKLLPETIEILSEKHRFLEFTKVRPTLNIPDQTDHLIVGHTVSQTYIDNKKRKLQSAPFVHTSKSLPKMDYEKHLFKNPKTHTKYKIDKKRSTLLHYSKRKSTVMGSNEMSMGPYTKGISGCGVWYIQSYEIAEPAEADFYLMGIITEYDRNKKLLLATKTEELVSLLQEAIILLGN